MKMFSSFTLRSLTSMIRYGLLVYIFKPSISEHAKGVITDQFGGVLENEDVQQLYWALIDLYDQV